MAENEQPTEYDDDEPQSGIFRWMSTLVVLAAIIGFLGLAWYAYKSGGDTIDEKDVELIKADKTPVKEAPANPGGIAIPNQDKTVYGLISGEHADKPTVERILPAPEEPVAHGNDTETWMSDKVSGKMDNAAVDAKSPDPATADAIAAAVVGDKAATASADAKTTATPAPTTPPAKKEQFNPAKALANNAAKPTPSTPIAIAPAPVAKPVQVAAAQKAETEDESDEAPKVAPAPSPSPAAVAKSTADAAPAPAPAANPKTVTPAAEATSAAPLPKGTRVQLGAYKSEKEAKADWEKISGKFADELGKRQYYIVRVELSKGTFYRLQVGPFDNVKQGEQLCLSLVSAGQGCLIAHDK